MGKGIVYCGDCGTSLREDDFAKNRAQTVDNVPYCTACRPLDRTPPTGSVKKIGPRRRSSTLPAVGPARKSGPRPVVLAAAGGGALVLLVLIVVVLSGGPSSPEPPPPDPQEDARRREREGRSRRERAEREQSQASKTGAALAQIRGVVAGDPEFLRQAEVASLYAAAMKEAGPLAGDVEREWLGYERKLEATARSAVEAAKAEADRLAASGDFASALERFDRLSPSFRASAPGKALEPRRRELEERLRIARLPPPPLHEASHLWKSDSVAALSDRALPRDSGDESIPRFTWWDRKGTEEWVTFGFPTARTVSACDVYWFDDTARGGGCGVPESWRLHYLDGEDWKEVRATSPYGSERDRMNRITFEAVPARALRVVAKLRPGLSAGILEWSVPGTDDIPRPPPPPAVLPPPSPEVVLEAASARVQGEKIAIKERDGRKYVGNWNNTGESVEFTARVPKAARYRVLLEYAAAANSGGELSASVGGAPLAATLAPTGDWKVYATIPLGEVSLPAGDAAIRLQSTSVLGEGLMNLRSLRLVPQ